MSLTRPRLAIAGFVIAVVAGAGHAQAADAKKFADQLVAAVLAGGKATTATYDQATGSGDQITVTGLKVVQDGDTSTLPPLVFTGVAPRAKGGFTAQKLEVGAASLVAHGDTTAWKSFEADNVLIPSTDEVKAKAHLAPFTHLVITGLSETGHRIAAPVTIDTLDVGVTADAEGAPNAFTAHVANIKLTPDFFAKNFLAKAYLGMLGYNSGFTINVDTAGAYVDQGDVLTLDKFVTDVSDVGKLTLSGKFSGVSLRKLGAMDVHDVQSTGKLDNFSFRFDNEGLVERLLDMQSKTQGIKREDAIAQATAGLNFFLISIPDQAFTSQVVSAVTSFLSQPKSITIALNPKDPVAFSQIFDVVGQSPETIPTVMGVTVSANQ